MTNSPTKGGGWQQGPTKENEQKFDIFRIFPAHAKMGPDGPKWGREDFFVLIQTLPTFWAERIFILRAKNQQRGFPCGSISSLGALGGAWIWI